MGASVLPDEVKAFLLRHIDSVAQLEAPVATAGQYRTRPGVQTCSSEALHISQETAEILARLYADGFLAFTTASRSCISTTVPHATRPIWSTKSPYSIPNISFRSRI